MRNPSSRQQAVACYFAGDYVAAAGLAVKPQTQSAGYTPPLAPAEPAASVEEVADPLGLGLGLGLDDLTVEDVEAIKRYVRTAKAKGLPRRTVIYKHALRNALIAPFTVIIRPPQDGG